MKFEGPADHVATPDPTIAIRAAIFLERPLLVKGEPGAGRTERARQIATCLVSSGTSALPKLHGAPQELHSFERLAFLARSRRS